MASQSPPPPAATTTTQPSFRHKASGFFSRLSRQPSTPQLSLLFKSDREPRATETPISPPLTHTSFLSIPQPFKDLAAPLAKSTPSTPSAATGTDARSSPAWDPWLLTTHHPSDTAPLATSPVEPLSLPPVPPLPAGLEPSKPAPSPSSGRASPPPKPRKLSSPDPSPLPIASPTEPVPARRPKKMSSFWRFFNKPHLQSRDADPLLPDSPRAVPPAQPVPTAAHFSKPPSAGSTYRHARSVSVNVTVTAASLAATASTTPVPKRPSATVSATDSARSHPQSDSLLDDEDFQTVPEYPSQRGSFEDGPAAVTAAASSSKAPEVTPSPNIVRRVPPSVDSDDVALSNLVLASRASNPSVAATTPDRQSEPPTLEGSAPTPLPPRSVSLFHQTPPKGPTSARTTPTGDSSTSATPHAGTPTLNRGNTAPAGVPYAAGTSEQDQEAQALAVARALFQHEDPSLFPEEYVEFLGKRGDFYARVRYHYFNHLDFTGSSLEEAFRALCAQLFIRGESQVIDRILIEFARRYWQCNPQHPTFTDEDVVYAIVFSLLLLNTDLHVSQSDEKISRSKFIKLTLTTVDTCRQITARKREESNLADAPSASQADAAATLSAAADPAVLTSPILSPMMKGLTLQSDATSPMGSPPAPTLSGRTTTASSNKRFSFFDSAGLGSLNAPKTTERVSVVSGPASSESASEHDRLVPVLKEMYSSIKSQKLAQPTDALAMSRSSISSFRSSSQMALGMGIGLSRSRSVSGMGGSNQGGLAQRQHRMFGGGRRALRSGGPGHAADTDMMGNGRFGNSAQSSPIGAVLAGATANLSPEVNLNQSRSVLNSSSPRLATARPSHSSPARSRAASISSSSPRNPLAGIAPSAFSDGDDLSYYDRYSQSLNASMLLGGGPHDLIDYPDHMPLPNHMGYDERFVKSSVLVRKHLMERTDRKATNRSWKQCYVVLEHGMLNMYKAERGRTDGSELTDPALQLGHVSLRHSLTNALPPPGYSRSRPHVFAIQLPHGGVYLFQAATKDQLKEWVDCCNYWAARESKEPLVGGVCNADHGWIEPNDGDGADAGTALSRPMVAPLNYQSAESSTSLHASDAVSDAKAPSQNQGDAKSIDTLMSSQASHSTTYTGHTNLATVPPPTAIRDWRPPTQSLMRSNLDETSQLRALLKQIAHLESELGKHQELRATIDTRFPPRSPIYAKAFSNWERKSQFLLRELIKYQTYADCLKQAIATRPAASSNGSEGVGPRPISVASSLKRLSRPPSYAPLNDYNTPDGSSIRAKQGGNSSTTPSKASTPVPTPAQPLPTDLTTVDTSETDIATRSHGDYAQSLPTPTDTPAVVDSKDGSRTSSPANLNTALAKAKETVLPVATLPTPTTTG
ncbi:hypothetical protein H4R35_003135 [Dimargaris xerosporica]|nr:hypothetical protein H4R35_003135 [Dimargaris xerosporica]